MTQFKVIAATATESKNVSSQAPKVTFTPELLGDPDKITYFLTDWGETLRELLDPHIATYLCTALSEQLSPFLSSLPGKNLGAESRKKLVDKNLNQRTIAIELRSIDRILQCLNIKHGNAVKATDHNGAEGTKESKIENLTEEDKTDICKLFYELDLSHLFKLNMVQLEERRAELDSARTFLNKMNHLYEKATGALDKISEALKSKGGYSVGNFYAAKSEYLAGKFIEEPFYSNGKQINIPDVPKETAPFLDILLDFLLKK